MQETLEKNSRGSGREGPHPWGLAGGPAVKTPCCCCRAGWFCPWSRTQDPSVMRPKKGADHARVTLGTCSSRVPLAPEGRASEGRAGARGPPAPRLSPPLLRLRGPPGAGPPCLLAPSLTLLALVDLGLGTWLASQDHRPPDALPCDLRVSPGPTEVQVRVGMSISERHVGDSPCRRGPAGHPCPPHGRGRCPRGACELWGLSWFLVDECGWAPGSLLGGAGLTLHLSSSQDHCGARVPALGPPLVPGGERTPR